jgi:hypothetical protein
MTGTYLLRLPGARGERSEVLGASLTCGTPTLHLHPDFQFATPTGRAGLSLGVFRRFQLEPGDVVVLHPSTLHGETGVSGRAGWHILHLPRTAVHRLAGSLAHTPVRHPGSCAAVIRDPGLATALIELITAAIGQRFGGAEFLQLTGVWLGRLTQGRDLTLPRLVCGSHGAAATRSGS